MGLSLNNLVPAVLTDFGFYYFHLVHPFFNYTLIIKRTLKGVKYNFEVYARACYDWVARRFTVHPLTRWAILIPLNAW